MSDILNTLHEAAEEMVKNGEMIKLPNGNYLATENMKKPTEDVWDEFFDIQNSNTEPTE